MDKAPTALTVKSTELEPNSLEMKSAELELKMKARLYEFYINAYLKGIAFFLAITGALLKFAIESLQYRQLFATAGFTGCILILIAFFYIVFQERTFRADFKRLADGTRTQPISTVPLVILYTVGISFWALVVTGWVYIYIWLPA